MLSAIVKPVLLHSTGVAWDEYLMFGGLGIIILTLLLVPRWDRLRKKRKKGALDEDAADEAADGDGGGDDASA